jgi:hypothetical protein
VQSPAEPFIRLDALDSEGASAPFHPSAIEGAGVVCDRPVEFKSHKNFAREDCVSPAERFLGPHPPLSANFLQVATHALLRHRCADSIIPEMIVDCPSNWSLSVLYCDQLNHHTGGQVP